MRFTDAATLLSLTSLVHAAPSLHGHQHKHAARQMYGWPSGGYPTESQPSGSKQGFQAGTFFVNWAIYARKFMVTDLPAEQLTKINYAFANLNNQTGEIILSDEWADLQFPYPGDVGTNGSQLLGNFNQLYKLKQKNRNLKVVLSVGGWSYRNNFKPAFSTEAGRTKFCDSTIQLIGDLGIDGIDFDYEYPEDTTAAHNFAKTVKYCRQIFDQYSAKYYNGYRFVIGISSPAGPQNYEIFPLAEIDQYVDNYNLMAFDYQGPGFSNFTGHLSNVYPSKKNPRSTNGWVVKTNSFTPFNTERAIEYYKTQIADPSKIQLGMPLYGRGFANVIDPKPAGNGMGMVFNGSTAGSFEAGVIDYKQLPRSNASLYTDWNVRAAWTYDRVAKEVITFDTPQVALWKTQYLKEQGLGGAWFWESSGDRPITDPKSLTRTVSLLRPHVPPFETCIWY